MANEHAQVAGWEVLKPTRIIVIIYVLIKQFFYFFAVDGYYWLPRAIASLLMLGIIFWLTGDRRFTNRQRSYLVPLSLTLIEIMLCALIGGDRLIYIFLMGSALISLLYLDIYGLTISMSVTALAIAFCAFVLRLPMMGITYDITDELFYFAGLLVMDMLTYSIGRYSVGSFQQSRFTGQTFRTIMENTPNYLVIINEKARVEFISDSFAKWLGISEKEYAYNRPLLDLFRWGELQMMLQEVMETGYYVEKNFELKTDDKNYWFMLRSALMGEDKIARMIELADITPIMEAKLEAEEATRAKSSFLANMSHEIRTPMNAIVGLTELVMLKPLDAEQRNHAVAIKGAAMSLLKIINDILDFSKIDAQKMEIIINPFDFSSLINDTVNIINIKAAAAGIVFTAFVDRDVPPRINSDELRLKQVLINLLNNAVKFTNEGCVSLHVQTERLRNGSLKLIFVVKDTGIGIKKEDIGRLFGAFQQMDTRRNRTLEGTGLGLVISRRLVELMGGAISVESVYGQGATFSAYVICPGEHRGQIASLPQPEAYRLLCYEPNIYHAEVLGKMLENLELSYVICQDQEGFEQELFGGGFTHVFFDKSARGLLENYHDLPKSALTMMKEVSDLENSGLNTINRPILLPSLAQVLSGEAGYDAANTQSEIQLGQFKTKNVRVLLVDDNPVNLMVAEGLLCQYDISVVMAFGGQEGIDKALAEEFDIIFMDHMMPDIDGIDATTAIREAGGRHENVPIIALSANAVSGTNELFLKAGMNGFLSKPIVIQQLHNILLEFLPPQKIVQQPAETGDERES